MRRFAQILLVLVLLAGAGVWILAWQSDASRLEATDFVLSVTSKILVAFLFILVIRYVVLAMLALLHHIRASKEPAWPSSFPPVSIVIPAYNEGPVIESAIEHALRQHYPNFEVIVVDDGSTDDTYDKARQIVERYNSPNLRVLTKANRGKASALNLGIAHARGDLVLCTDSDSRLDPDATVRAVKHFNDPYVGAVAGNVKVANRLNSLTRLQALEYIEGLNLVRAAQAYFHRVTVIPGPFGMFRKDVLDEVGRYQDDTFAEDCDLTLRMMLAGWDIKYESQSMVWTEAPENIDGLVLQRYRWGRGVLQAINKNKRYLLGGGISFGSWISFWAFVFDGLALPSMNLIGIACFVFATMGGNLSVMIPLWWAQLTVLDAVIAVACIAAEGEQLSLALNAVAYRLFFIPFVDTMRLFAWLDELFSVRMKWMRLERFGRI